MSPRTDSHPFDLAAVGDGLEVARHHEQLVTAATTGAFVVTAPPGTGKTTYVPPLLANLLDGTGGGRVIVTQPRRVAVRAAARRLCALTGSAVGGSVGFTVRGERRVSPDTVLEIMTPGVLLRRVLQDPALEGVGAVVLDEVHERSLDTDLLLGMLTEVRALRGELLLVAMSATLDAHAVADVITGESSPASIVDIPSVLHPLEITYAPAAGPRLDTRGLTRDFLAHLCDVTLQAQALDGMDALVFVPSARDVDDLTALLRARSATEVLPLHGRLSSREQDRATSGRTSVGDTARIVVSTAVAESSLTVPGVRLVIDAGLSREVRRDRARDMTGLVTVTASRASVDQRAGRAARQGPGRAIRAFPETDVARMNPAAPPEIASADLVDAALLLAAWGTPGGRGLPLLTRPPAHALEQATSVLQSLQLAGPDGRATPLGLQVAHLPIGARQTRALLSGTAALGDARTAAEVVAATSDDHSAPGADLTQLLRDLRAGRAPGAMRWRREARRLEAIAASAAPVRGAASTSSTGVVLALGRPEWIARRTAEGSRSYLLASGTRAALPEGSTLLGAQWLAVQEVQLTQGRITDGTGAVIRMAAPLAESDALDVGAPLVVEGRSARIVDGKVRVRLERRLGQIVLATTPAAPVAGDIGPAFASHLRELGIDALHWDGAAASLRARLALLHRELGPPWPAMDAESLMAALDTWLGPDLAALRPGASLARIDVTSALCRLLPWPEARRLEELVPQRLRVPSGSTVAVDYPADGDGPPVIAVKLQEVFGLATTPRLVDGRVPVLFHLLSPARRPLAVTADLQSFWDGPYRQVRSEMRGRYPRHPWPEDPWSAPATARTTKRH